MGKGSGITRGDRRRNSRKARLRALVPQGYAVAGLEWALYQSIVAAVPRTLYPLRRDASDPRHGGNPHFGGT